MNSPLDFGHTLLKFTSSISCFPLPPYPLGQAEVTAVEESGLSWPLLGQQEPHLEKR